MHTNTDVRIIFPQYLYQKMLAYTLASNGEISGFGKTKVIHKTDVTLVTILDIRIFEQIVNPVHTKLPIDVLSKFYVGLAREGEKTKNWNLWWHSHNDFGVFFSGEDEDTIRELSTNRSLFSTCINKMGDIVGRQDHKSAHVADASVVIENIISKSLLSACRAEVKRKVTYEDTDYKNGSYKLDEEIVENENSVYETNGYCIL